MKKIFYSIFLLILTLVIVNPINVKADYCWERTTAQKCNNGTSIKYDEAGNLCAWTGTSCKVSKYACDKKKHCTCYKADTCPAKDDYGNYCNATGTSCSLYQSHAAEDDGSIQDNYVQDGDVTCGNGLTFNKSIANITYYMVQLFQILGPIFLIIWGSIDLAKGVASGKDDDIKKGQTAFVKRLVTAIIMFLVIIIVRFLISVLSNNTVLDCFNCFVNGANRCK